MGFASCYASSEKYVGLTLDVLNGRLFPGWNKNDDRKGVDCVHPLFLGGCEVKADFRAHETGNVFIETECSGKPSGCYKYEDMVLWAQWVDATKEMLLLDVRHLRARMPEVGRKLTKVGDGNADGYLVKLDWMKKIALLDLHAEDKGL
jgi:hypothetical protein